MSRFLGNAGIAAKESESPATDERAHPSLLAY
jgi:hypothetical protein